MSRFKRPISFLLLFVFASLFAKNILPTSSLSLSSDCNDIAHIHNYAMSSTPTDSVLHALESSKDPGDHDDCHAGKSVTSSILFTGPVIEISFPVNPSAFHPIYSINTNFLSPYLEPQRKPPRSV